MNTELNITPGPWYRAGRFGQEVRRYWPDHEDELGGVDLIATVHRVSDERDANAQAIAAVPELLDALIARRDNYGKYGRLVNDPTAPGELIAKINAALEKAGVTG